MGSSSDKTPHGPQTGEGATRDHWSGRNVLRFIFAILAKNKIKL